VKFIASLRHPVDRAYSAFWHNIRQGRIPFDTDFYTFFQQSDKCGIRSRGYYGIHLTRYLKYFPHEWLCILIYEEICQDSQRAIADCLKFLEVDPQFSPRALTTKINQGGRALRRFNRQARKLRLRLQQALLWAIQRQLVPHRLQRPVIAAGQRTFNQLIYRRGLTVKHTERLDADLRQALLDQYYMSDIKQLEDLLGRDLAIWYQPSCTLGEIGLCRP
jgi:Sulfotransferase domain